MTFFLVCVNSIEAKGASYYDMHNNTAQAVNKKEDSP